VPSDASEAFSSGRHGRRQDRVGHQAQDREGADDPPLLLSADEIE